MIQQNYTSYFRVFKNDTAITEIFTNDFLKRKFIRGSSYIFPVNELLFYGYKTRDKAMEMAKAGALAYINSLIDLGQAGENMLLQYRMDHYEDLNINLVETNIYKIEHNLPGAVDQHLL